MNREQFIDLLVQLDVRSRNLVDADDEIYNLLRNIDTALSELRLGVPLSHKLDIGTLLYEKVGQKKQRRWTLLLRRPDGVTVAVEDASQDERAVVVRNLTRFIKSLPAQLEKMIKQRKAAIATAKGVLEAFRLDREQREAAQ